MNDDALELSPEMLQALPAAARAFIERQTQALAEHRSLIASKDREITLRDAQLEKLKFEIARFRRWRFGAKAEAMSAEQRRLFEETLVEDEASLQARLEQLRAQAAAAAVAERAKKAPRQPRRQALPEHLRRVEHRHEPESTTCPRKLPRQVDSPFLESATVVSLGRNLRGGSPPSAS